MENHKNNLIFTSYGLTSERGRKLIFKALKNDDTLYKKGYWFLTNRMIIWIMH